IRQTVLNAVVLASWVLLMAGCPCAAIADDVIVRTVAPDTQPEPAVARPAAPPTETALPDADAAEPARAAAPAPPTPAAKATPEKAEPAARPQPRAAGAHLRSEARAGRGAIDRYVPGVRLTDEQTARIADVLAKRAEVVRKSDVAARADWKTALEKLNENPNNDAFHEQLKKARDRMLADRQAANDAVRRQIEEVLTADQKQQAAEGVRRQGVISAMTVVNIVYHPFERLGLSKDQSAKTAELAEAARDAMLKLGPGDDDVRQDLADQFRKDLLALMTDEQKRSLGGR
ncbi:MAG: hypothetical protein PHU85_14895, partial [Phycisphaerae bacterium]|nr:hypothetical protein [Phycisphaerae bacterium]